MGRSESFAEQAQAEVRFFAAGHYTHGELDELYEDDWFLVDEAGKGSVALNRCEEDEILSEWVQPDPHPEADLAPAFRSRYPGTVLRDFAAVRIAALRDGLLDETISEAGVDQLADSVPGIVRIARRLQQRDLEEQRRLKLHSEFEAPKPQSAFVLDISYRTTVYSGDPYDCDVEHELLGLSMAIVVAMPDGKPQVFPCNPGALQPARELAAQVRPALEHAPVTY